MSTKFAVLLFIGASLQAQTNPLWHEEKVKNYLPHMTWPEVQDLLTRTDMVIIPVPSLEQHGPQTPIGTDFLSGVERAKLVAQRTDVLVAPVIMAGSSPYHMGLPRHHLHLHRNAGEGLLRSCAKPHSPRLPTYPLSQQPRRQSVHDGFRRRPRESGDARHRRRTRRRGGRTRTTAEYFAR